MSGKIRDSLSNLPIHFATISVYLQKDSSLIAYQLSDASGDFSIPNLPKGKLLRVVTSVVGYKIHRREIFIATHSSKFNENYFLIPDATVLPEILLNSERPPVIVNKGMITFDAAVFKVPPNALVEDLLKKIPGIEITKDGTIFVNGGRVNRITVDGKYFFGTDLKIATQNLPANIIDNVQIGLDLDELEKKPEGGLDKIGSVINLNLKREIKKGWFGKSYIGYGTKNRHEAGAIVNKFTDTIQLTFLGFRNNINKSGSKLKDIQDINSFQNTLNTTLSSSFGNRNDLSGYFSDETGIYVSSGIGVNLNYSPRRNTNYFLQYFFGVHQPQVNNHILNNQFINDTTISTSTFLTKTRNIYSHSFSIGSNSKISKLATIGWQINYSLLSSRDFSNNQVSISNNKIGMTSFGNGARIDTLKYNELNESFDFTKGFSKNKKRKIIINQSLVARNIHYKLGSEYLTYSFYPSNDTLYSSYIRNEEKPNFEFSIGAAVVNPIVENLTLRISTNYFFGKYSQNVRTYNIHLSQIINDHESEFRRTDSKLNNSANLIYEKKHLNISLGMIFMSRVIKYHSNIASLIQQNSSDWLPFFRIFYKHFSINYKKEINLPRMTDILPTADSTNPYNVTIGTPSLVPTTNHNLTFSFYNHNLKKSAYSNITIGGTVKRKDIIYARKITQQGTQIVQPLNAGNAYSFFTNFNINKDFKKGKEIAFSTNLKCYFGFSKRSIQINDLRGDEKHLVFSPDLNFRISLFQLIELTLGYQFSLNSSRYSIPNFTNSEVAEHLIGSRLLLYCTKDILLESNITYKIYNQNQFTQRSNYPLLMNGSISYFLSNRKLEAKLTIFDILNKNFYLINLNSQNYYTEIEGDVLPQFGMISLIFNFKALTFKGTNSK